MSNVYRFKQYKKFVVTQAYVANLPGISYLHYGTYRYWQQLLEVNGLSDPISQIALGVTLIIPPDSSLTPIIEEGFQ